MKTDITLPVPTSPQLRGLLEHHLTGLFDKHTISKYLAVDACTTEMQIADTCTDDTLAVPYIKLAFNIWKGMDATDRHAVLGKFQCLYNGLLTTGKGNRNVLIFCALFVHEFAAILVAAMGWPD